MLHFNLKLRLKYQKLKFILLQVFQLLSGNEVGRVNGRLLVTKLPVTLDSAITDIEMWHTDQRRETGYLQLFVSGSLFIALKRSH